MDSSYILEKISNKMRLLEIIFWRKLIQASLCSVVKTNLLPIIICAHYNKGLTILFKKPLLARESFRWSASETVAVKWKLFSFIYEAENVIRVASTCVTPLKTLSMKICLKSSFLLPKKLSQNLGASIKTLDWLNCICVFINSL